MMIEKEIHDKEVSKAKNLLGLKRSSPTEEI